MSDTQIIGLTGGIGTGKTFVSQIIKSMGFFVLDADQIAHQVLEQSEVIKLLKSSFGSKIVQNDGLINRKALGTIVFKDPQKLNELNEILDPFLRTAIISNLKKAQKPVFIEIQLLFERQYEEYVDKVIVVYADNKTAVNRIIRRDRLTLEMAQKKICSQMSIDEKVKRTDYVIDTTKKNIKEQVLSILKKINLV